MQPELTLAYSNISMYSGCIKTSLPLMILIKGCSPICVLTLRNLAQSLQINALGKELPHN
jgi:hypothetical protein